MGTDKKKDIKEVDNDKNETRLNKFLSHNTKYSRREADRFIQDGKVMVNNRVVTDMATKVTNSDKVKLNDRYINPYIKRIPTVMVYNKQKGEIVSKKDPQGRKTIYDTLSHRYKHFIPIGRLDFASEGLLLLTDNVEIADSLMHSNIPRVYKIKIRGKVTNDIINAMNQGLELSDATAGAHTQTKQKSMTFAPFSGYEILTNKRNYSKLKVILTEGQNREIRRFFASFKADVVDLKRISFGSISLNNLPSGKNRYLSKEEYKDLKEFMKLKSLN
jgi:23S rRNA pseudouridine2605 synthase